MNPPAAKFRIRSLSTRWMALLPAGLFFGSSGERNSEPGAPLATGRFCIGIMTQSWSFYILIKSDVRRCEVGQTIVFCRLSGGRTVARYNRPRKAMVCPTRRPARRPAFSRLSPLTISRFLPQETFPKLLSGLPSGKAGIGLSMTATTRGIACGHGAADGSGNADGEDAVQRGAVSCVESSRFTPS